MKYIIKNNKTKKKEDGRWRCANKRTLRRVCRSHLMFANADVGNVLKIHSLNSEA